MGNGLGSAIRMVAAAAAAATAVRATERLRTLLDDTQRPALTAAPPRQPLQVSGHDEPGMVLTTSDDHVVTRVVAPVAAHAFGPAPVVAPSRGIGFRAEPAPPRRIFDVEPVVDEMPIISRPPATESHEPDEPEVEVVRSAATWAADPVDPAADDDADADEVDDDLDDEIEDVAGPLADDVTQTPAVSAAVLAFAPPAPVLDITDPEPAHVPVEADEAVAPPTLAAPAVAEPVVPPPAALPAPVVTEPVVAPAAVAPPVPVAPPAPVAPEPIAEPLLDPVASIVEPAPAMPGAAVDDPAIGRHRRFNGAVSGVVTNTHGRGLAGITVVVVTPYKEVVATAVTGPRGVFMVDDLEPGSYRVKAVDGDTGDFETTWFGGSPFRKADVVSVRMQKTRRKVRIVLRSAARIDTEVKRSKKKVTVAVQVTDRATGAPAAGAVRLSTSEFGVKLPLDDGRTTITLYGDTRGSRRTVARRLRVEYLGSRHTRDEAGSAKL